MHTLRHKTKCSISKNGQFTWPLCTMRKFMKCEGFELIWDTLSLPKLKEITRSCFTWCVGIEKRSRTPYFFIISNMTPLCTSIAFRICSIFISSQLERTSFTNPLFVSRLGFRFWNFAFNPPFKFFHVWLTNWSDTLQPGLLIGNPPSSSSSSPVNSTISVWSFTFPAPGQTSMPNFPHAACLHTL